MSQFELTILDWIQETMRCTVLDTVMPLISHLGEAGIVWIVLTLVLLCTKRYRRAGLSCACALVLDLLACNIILKPLVGRVRPFDLNPLAPELLVAPPTDFSFPSGHTAASFAATGALYASGTRLWMPALGLSLLMGLSRLYLYVHYPSDVLGGLILGTLVGFGGYRLALWLTERFAARQRGGARK